MMGAPWRNRKDRIPNAPVREAYLASSMAPSDICSQLGWMRHNTQKHQADTTRLMRTLGLSPTLTRNKAGQPRWSTNSTMTITNAKAVCAALRVDFDELYPSLPGEPPACFCGCGEPMIRPAARCGFCELEAAEQVAA